MPESLIMLHVESGGKVRKGIEVRTVTQKVFRVENADVKTFLVQISQALQAKGWIRDNTCFEDVFTRDDQTITLDVVTPIDVASAESLTNLISRFEAGDFSGRG